MAIISFNRKRDNILNDFARKYRDRTLSYLHNAFSLRLEDCEDVFQEASIVLYNAAVDGKLDGLKSSLYTYFIGICKNKARELMRANGKIPLSSIDEFDDDDEQRHNTTLNKADKILNDIDTDARTERHYTQFDKRHDLTLQRTALVVLSRRPFDECDSKDVQLCK